MRVHKTLAYKVGLGILVAIAIVVWSLVALESYLQDASPIASASPQDQVAAAHAASIVPMHEYIEITDSCGPYFEGTCVNARSGPGEEYSVLMHLRTGIVLKVSGTAEGDGRTWYKVVFDEWLRYPERVQSDMYVAADYVRLFSDVGPLDLPAGVQPESSKRILIRRGEQMLYAYDRDVLFMEEKISTGLEFTPTPRGVFSVFRKTPSRYMQGPIFEISEKSYDLPGVPWNLYFTEQGAVIHGAYWHDHFGEQWSNGCVNLPPQKAKQLYEWADLGTQIIVQD